MAEHTRSEPDSLDTLDINFRKGRSHTRSRSVWLRSQEEQNSDEITPIHKRNFAIEDSENSIRDRSEVNSANSSPASRGVSPVQSSIRNKPPVAPKPGKRSNKDDTVPEKTDKPLIPPKPSKHNTTDTFEDDVTSIRVKFTDKPTSIPRQATQLESDEPIITPSTAVHPDTDPESETESDSNNELVTGKNADMAEQEFDETYKGVRKNTILSKPTVFSRNSEASERTAANNGYDSDQERSTSSEDEGKWTKQTSNKRDSDRGPSRERKDSLTLHRERLNKIFADDDLSDYESDSLLNNDPETSKPDRPAQSREQRDHKLSTCDELLESSSSTSASQQSDVDSENQPSMKSPGKLEFSDEDEFEPINEILPRHSTLPREPNTTVEIYRERLGLPTSATFPQDGKFPGCSYVSAQKRRIDWRVQHPEEISASSEDNETSQLDTPSLETDDKTAVDDQTNISDIEQNQAEIVPVKDAVSPTGSIAKEKINNLFPIPAEEQWSYSPNSSSMSSRKSDNLQWSASEESLGTSISSSILGELESSRVRTSPKHVESPKGILPATTANEVDIPVRENTDIKQDHRTCTAVETSHDNVAATSNAADDDDQLSKPDITSEGNVVNVTSGDSIKQTEPPTICSEREQSDNNVSSDQNVQNIVTSSDRMPSPQQGRVTVPRTDDPEIDTPSNKSNKPLPSNTGTDHSLPADSTSDIGHTEDTSETETSNSRESQEENNQSGKATDKLLSVGRVPLTRIAKGHCKFNTYRKQQGYVRERHHPRLISPTLQCRSSEAFRRENIERPGCKSDIFSFSTNQERIKPTSELVRKFDNSAKQRRTKYRRSPEGNDNTDPTPDEIYRETFSGTDIDKNLCKEASDGLKDDKDNDSMGRILPEFTEAKTTSVLESVTHIFSRRPCAFPENDTIQVYRAELEQEPPQHAVDDSPSTDDACDGRNGELEDRQNKKASSTDVCRELKASRNNLTPLVTACIGSVILTVTCMAVVWKLYVGDCECECACDKPNGVFDCLYRYLYKEIFS